MQIMMQTDVQVLIQYEVKYIHARKINKYNKLNNAEKVASDQVNAGVYKHVKTIRYTRTESKMC